MNSARRACYFRPTIAWIRTGLIFIALAACIGGCHRKTPPQEQVRVFTSVYALADIVRQIGQDRVNVEWLVETGQSLAQLNETPQRRNQWRSADLVVTRGSAEPWMVRGTGETYGDRRLIRLDLLPAAQSDDPSHYLWLDPQVVLELADELATRLSALRPRDEAMFKANARQFRRQIMDATDAARPAMDNSDGKFLSLDPGFQPLAKWYGLTSVQPPTIDFDHPTSFSVKQLHDAVQGANVHGIFVNQDVPMLLRRDWQQRLGIDVVPLDALGSSAPSGRSTYLAILRYDLDELIRGTRSAATLPATLPGQPTP